LFVFFNDEKEAHWRQGSDRVRNCTEKRVTECNNDTDEDQNDEAPPLSIIVVAVKDLPPLNKPEHCRLVVTSIAKEKCFSDDGLYTFIVQDFSIP